MKQNVTKGYLVLFLIFVLISVVSFALPVEKGAAFWVTYAFTLVAIAAQVGIWKRAFAGRGTLKSKFLGIPSAHLGTVYLIVQLVALLVFLFIPTLPIWGAVIACVAIAVISALCMIAADVGRDEIDRIDTAVQKKVFYIKGIQSEVELLAEKEPDSATKTALLQLAEKVRFSDPMSNEALAALEEKITSSIAGLGNSADKEDSIAQIALLLDERNKKCRLLK